MKVESKYRTRFFIGMALYLVTIFLASYLESQMERSVLSYIVTLTPTLPVAYAMVNCYWGIQGLDELERRIQMESIMVAAFIVAGFAFSWGLLEISELVPHFQTFMFAPGMFALYGLANHFVRRRYQ